jgi:hypothetical protein
MKERKIVKARVHHGSSRPTEMIISVPADLDDEQTRAYVLRVYKAARRAVQEPSDEPDVGKHDPALVAQLEKALSPVEGDIFIELYETTGNGTAAET